MKARPILFSGPMVRALLDGRKTQTRRTLKPEPSSVKALGPGGALVPFKRVAPPPELPTAICEIPVLARYGAQGDLLYVRETWCPSDTRTGAAYCADAPIGSDQRGMGWRPSIHMPRWASRLTLSVTGVRIERLNSCSEADAIAEGVTPGATYGGKVETWLPSEDDRSVFYPSARGAYAALWRKINGADSWDANPWVWVVEFAVHSANVDTFIAARAA